MYNTSCQHIHFNKAHNITYNQVGRELSQNPPIYMNGYGTIKLRIHNAVLSGNLMYLSPINYNDPNYFISTPTMPEGSHGITNSTTLIPTP